MNGRQTALVLVAAALMGGAAGALASFVLAQKEPAAPPAPSPAVLARLKAAEDGLSDAKAALERSRKIVAELEERVTKSELAASRGAAGVGAQTVRVGGRRVAGDRNGEKRSAADPSMTISADDVKLDGAELGAALSSVKGQVVNFGFDQLKAGLDLRKLPEDQRWQKAKDDLGLTWNQVEAMKQAVADRDKALKDAMTTEKTTDADGNAVTIQRPDPGKTAHAEADYQDRVNAALNDDQRSNWRSKGYDDAFGSGPFGAGHGTMVMTIGVSKDKADAPKEGAK